MHQVKVKIVHAAGRKLGLKQGQDVLFLFKKIDGNKKITGVLKGYDNDSITLELTDIKTGKTVGSTFVLDRKEIAKASLAVRFE